jgi:predicted negative regulator of RcsB-dependent stress response
MATHLDLEEQEQLDQLKAFWNQYGNLITTVLVLAVAAYLAWLGWNAWQRDQGAKAGSMYDELDRAAQAGDAARANSIFGDMKERFPRTTFTGQGGLLAAKVAADKGQADVAQTDLAWVAQSASEGAYRAVAKLRMAGLLLDDKKFDEALKQLDGIDDAEFAALVADRRGDIQAAQGKIDDARASYEKALAAMDAKVDYRRVVEAKLNVLGTHPAPAPAPVAASAAASAQ